MNAELFYSITGEHWRREIARARASSNSIVEQIRAVGEVGRAEGNALLAAFRNFGAAAGQPKGLGVRCQLGEAGKGPAAPIHFIGAGSASRERSADVGRAEAGADGFISPEGKPGAAIDGVPSLEPTREIFSNFTSGAQVTRQRDTAAQGAD